MNRRRFLKYSAAAAVSAPIIESVTEPARLEITSNRVSLSAAPTTSLSVVQITDLHLPRFGARQQRVALAANEAKPDILVITGDSVDAPDKAPDGSGIVRITGIEGAANPKTAGRRLPSLYVSRGLVTSIVTARFCSIPELARFELLV